MIITFWGVRGSVPSPGLNTLRYGGNTACISVQIGNKMLVIDAGTGIRPLGAMLAGNGEEIFVLLTHAHADHVMGFPHFSPLYEPGRPVHLLDCQQDGRNWSLLELLDGTLFPMRPERLCCTCRRAGSDTPTYLRRHGFELTRLALNHPGGAYGYRIVHGGRTLVHMTDNELDPPGSRGTSFASFVRFCQGADVLCHDAQYLAEDMPAKRGWGHSSVEDACRLAAAGRVKCLVLFHHDPDRSDDALDDLQGRARRLLKGSGIACTAAYEGLRIDLDSRSFSEP